MTWQRTALLAVAALAAGEICLSLYCRAVGLQVPIQINPLFVVPPVLGLVLVESIR
jgi:hypothetical protein